MVKISADRACAHSNNCTRACRRTAGFCRGLLKKKTKLILRLTITITKILIFVEKKKMFFGNEAFGTEKLIFFSHLILL